MVKSTDEVRVCGQRLCLLILDTALGYNLSIGYPRKTDCKVIGRLLERAVK